MAPAGFLSRNRQTRSLEMLNHSAVPSYSLRIGIVLAAALLLLGAATESRAAGAALQACKSAWNDSPASNTCTNAQIAATGVEGDDCEISAQCTSGGSQSLTSITVDVNRASGLNNCEGSLTDGSC